MKVAVKDLGTVLEIKNKGIEFGISNPKGEHQGDLFLTTSGLIWCEGKTWRENGKKVSWDKFRAWMMKGCP